MTEMNTLKDLYIEQLRDLYSAETQMLDVLPKLADAASDADLQERFRTHHAETQEHARRLERIIEDLGERAGGHRCKAMAGLVSEATDMLAWKADPDVLDAGLIAAQQRMEHYEIAGYGTVRTFASRLGFEEHQRLLQDTLNEEGGTDRELTGLANEDVDPEAGL